MTHSPEREDLQLADYTGVLRRRWWIVVGVALIGLVGAAGYFGMAHKVYTASASVYVTATSGTANQVANGRTTGSVNLDTEAQVAQSVTVAQAAAKLMHAIETPQQLVSRVSVTVPPNSQVLIISCQASSGALAANCAQSFAQAYLNYNSAATITASSNQIAALQAKISALEAASAKLTVEAASLPPNSTQRAADDEQLSSDHSQLGSLNNQVAQLTAELADPSSGSIISNATAPAAPSIPKMLLIVPSGLLAGLLAGLVLAFVVDRRDQRIRSPRDVARLGVPVLMSVPLKQPAPKLAIAAPRSPSGRAFAELAHVLTGSLGTGNHVILVTGSSVGRGASLVAANLAVALSRQHPDVILLCADVEQSCVPAMFGLPSAPGLTDILAGGASAGAAGRRPAAAPRLLVILPGSEAEAEDLQRDAVDRLLNGLRREARWVVVEAPAVTSGPDVYPLAAAADVSVLVAEFRRTRQEQITSGVQHLDRAGAAVLGAVVLPPPEAAGMRAVPAVGGDAAAADDATGVRAEASGWSVDRPDAEDPELTQIISRDWSQAEEASRPMPRS